MRLYMLTARFAYFLDGNYNWAEPNCNYQRDLVFSIKSSQLRLGV